MMSSLERKVVRWITAFFYGCAFFLLVGMGVWFYPRQVVSSATLMTTDKAEYRLGEVIYVSGKTWVNVASQVDFNVRLICNGVKYPYTQINDLNVTRQKAPVEYRFPYPPIPKYITPGKCRIETTAKYPVQVLPLLTRDYYYVFDSNEFMVEE